MPTVARVVSVTVNLNIRYWRVETDLGERLLALKQTSKNAVWLSDDHLVLRDTMGCLYEVNPLSALDPRSKAEVEGILQRRGRGPGRPPARQSKMSLAA